MGSIFRNRTERNIEYVLEDDEFEFRRVEESKDVIWMLGIMSEWTFDIDEEVCACYIESQKALDSVNVQWHNYVFFTYEIFR